MFKNKKGIIFTVAITAGILLALALVIFVLFGGAGFFIWIVGVSVFRLAGIVVLIFAGLGLIRGRPVPWFVWVIGLVLVLLPFVSDVVANLSLAVVAF